MDNLPEAVPSSTANDDEEVLVENGKVTAETRGSWSGPFIEFDQTFPRRF
jgi:hypothetical protein